MPFVNVIKSAAAEPWTPIDLGATFLAWYDASLLTGSDNDQVAAWADSSGNGNNLSQGTAGLRPLLRTAFQNGKNVLEFPDATEHRFTVPNIFSGKSSGSCFHVVQGYDDASHSGGWDGWGTDPTNANHSPFSDGNIYDGFGSTLRKSCGNPTPSMAGWRIVGRHSAASDYKIFIDATQLFSTGTNTVGFHAAPKIGGNNVAGFHFQGHVAEYILVDSVLAQADRERVEGYLAHKWGLAGSLPALHPYKTDPPV